MHGAILRKYGASATINFYLVKPDGVDFESAATFAAGDLTIMKDEAAEANTANLPTDEGQGYSLVLTAAEMQAARIVIYLVDQTATKVWLDTAIVIETYGNASAQHAFDMDSAKVDLNNNQSGVTIGVTNKDAATLHRGTAVGGGANTIDLDAGASPTSALYVGAMVCIVSGTGIGQSRKIIAYNGAFKRATVEPNWTTNPASGSVFTVQGQARATVEGTKTKLDDLNDVDAATVNTEVDNALDTAIPGSPTANSVNERLKALDDNYTTARAGNLDNLDVAVSSRSTLTAAQVNAEVDTAIADARLDELASATAGGVDPTAGSLLDQMMNKDGSQTFSAATDSLEAIRDRGDAAWAGGGGGSETTLDAGTAQAGGTNTITLRSGASSVDDYYNNAIVAITGGTGAGQAAIIEDYTGSTRVAQVSTAWATQPDNTSVYKVFPFGAVPGATAPTAGQVADAVWDEPMAAHQVADTAGQDLHFARAWLANKKVKTVSSGVIKIYDNDGTTLLLTVTPSDDGDDTITHTPS